MVDQNLNLHHHHLEARVGFGKSGSSRALWGRLLCRHFLNAI